MKATMFLICYFNRVQDKQILHVSIDLPCRSFVLKCRIPVFDMTLTVLAEEASQREL